MKRRSRHTSIVPEGRKRLIISVPSERDVEIFQILHPSIGHRFLPSNWVKAHFKGTSNDIIHRLGHLRENGWLIWSDAPLNVEFDFIRHGIYELSQKAADHIGMPLPKFPRNEVAHELIGSLRACSMKFEARALGIPFAFFPPATYTLPSGKVWQPDEKPILLGDTLIHFEDERRANNIANEEKILKAVEYIRSEMYSNDAKSGLVFFLSTNNGHTEALKDYVKENYGKCSFLAFATTEDWINRRRPNPAIPLVPQWERVGYPPLTLNNLKGE